MTEGDGPDNSGCRDANAAKRRRCQTTYVPVVPQYLPLQGEVGRSAGWGSATPRPPR